MESNDEQRSTPGREVGLEDVRHVAELANLRLTAAEEVSLGRDLSRILDYIAQLGEANTDGVEPMAQVSEVLNNREAAALRIDQVRPSLDRDAVMRSAPETDGRFFKVPKVVER